jgi:hypothetical protein
LTSRLWVKVGEPQTKLTEPNLCTQHKPKTHTYTGGKAVTSPMTGGEMDPMFLPNRLVRSHVLKWIEAKRTKQQQQQQAKAKQG